MGKDKIKIKKIPKKASLIPKGLKKIKSKNESSNMNKIKIDEILNKKLKNKKTLLFDESKKGNNDYKLKKIKKKLNKNSKRTNNDLIDDTAICTHLLLNSYSNTNTLDFLPEKTIEQRIKTMKDKIISLFPELKNMK